MQILGLISSFFFFLSFMLNKGFELMHVGTRGFSVSRIHENLHAHIHTGL